MTTNSTIKKRVLILGGGFGGMYAAMRLDRLITRNPNVEVTLVSEENFFLFTPMLHEVAAGDLDMTHIVNPIRKLLRRVQFFEGRVERIDMDARRVAVSHSSDRHEHEMEYDHLIVALGSTTNFFGLPGLEECALTMKTLGDAIHLRNEVIERLEEADTECAAGSRQPLLTFVIAGGGFAGVETAAGINDFARESLRYYRNIDEKMLQIVVVHPGQYILPELGENLGRYAQGKLEQRGVDIRGGTRVKGVSGNCVMLSDGSSIPACTIIWTAGTTSHPLCRALPCADPRGRISVNEFLESPEWPGVWALGDCALIPSPDGTPYPPTAQHAIREGHVAADNVWAAINGVQKRPFVFKTIGQLAAIGRRTGVARIMGRNFSGFIAWWLWRTIYLAKLPRFEKKLRVALDWTLDLVFARDLVQFATPRSGGESTHDPHHEAVAEPRSKAETTP